jgi:NAD(P)-dependent dehydrogenase (short-subunit alcohol dehydrogenase family)
MGSMTGRVVMITGAAGGVGSATARLLAARGARLVLVDVRDDDLEAVAADLGDNALAASADITDIGQLDEVVRAALVRFGGIDVVVANAAIDAYASVAEIEPTIFDRVVEVNLLGTFRTVRTALPAMAGRHGHILIINSLGSIIAPPFLSAYAASKAGLAAFADSLRLELRGSGTTVGTLYFGAVDTEHFRTGMAHPLMQRANARIPKSLTSPSTVDDAAAAIERVIERRTRRAVFPRSNLPMLWAPKMIQRVTERWISN